MKSLITVAVLICATPAMAGEKVGVSLDLPEGFDLQSALVWLSTIAATGASLFTKTGQGFWSKLGSLVLSFFLKKPPNPLLPVDPNQPVSDVELPWLTSSNALLDKLIATLKASGVNVDATIKDGIIDIHIVAGKKPLY